MPSAASGSSRLQAIASPAIVVGARQSIVDLPVEGALAQRDHGRTPGHDDVGEALRLRRRASAAGTTRLTSPQASAVGASIISPVSSISITRLRPILRATPTAGVEQKTPTFTPGSANFAVSAATARSHIDTSWQPAAVAMPWTRAMTGCGKLRELLHHPAAGGEEFALPFEIRMSAHFLQVVAGAEPPARAPR